MLVIEDDDEIRDSLLEALTDYGHPAEGASNGKAGLEALKRSPLPCLILLDIMMPVMDGQTFREQQLKDPAYAAVPVILVSADPDVCGLAQQLKTTAWLKKPVKTFDLLRLVQQHCAH